VQSLREHQAATAKDRSFADAGHYANGTRVDGIGSGCRKIDLGSLPVCPSGSVVVGRVRPGPDVDVLKLSLDIECHRRMEMSAEGMGGGA